MILCEWVTGEYAMKVNFGILSRYGPGEKPIEL